MVFISPAPNQERKRLPALTKRNLPPSGTYLLEIIRSISFGRIEQLHVDGGDPVFRPPPKIVRELKFGAKDDVRPKSALDDYVLKAEVREMFAAIAALGDGVVDCIEVRHGLPFRLIVSEAAESLEGSSWSP